MNPWAHCLLDYKYKKHETLINNKQTITEIQYMGNDINKISNVYNLVTPALPLGGV